MRQTSHIIQSVIAAALVAGAIGYLLGAYHLLAVVQAAAHNYTTHDTALEHWGEQHSVTLTILGAMFGYLISLGASPLGWLIGKLSRRVAPDPIDILFRNQLSIHIVLPQTPRLSYQPLGAATSTQFAPRNATFISAGDALAISLIRGHIERVYRGKKRIVFHYAGSLLGVDKAENYLTIGGPAVNETVLHLLRHVGQNFTVAEGSDKKWKFSETNPAHEYNAERDSAEPDAAITKDYGAAVVLRSPNTAGQMVAMLFGLNPIGTTAAAEAFVGKVKPSRQHRELAKFMRAGATAVAIVEARNVIGSIEFESNFVKTRAL